MSALAGIGKTVIIHKDELMYHLGPSIVILDNGEWLAGFNQSRRREKRMHPPSDPLYRNYLIRSSDQGETWGEPYCPDYEWSGMEHPCVEQLSDGTVALTHFRFGWYPLELAGKGRAAGEPIRDDLPNRDLGYPTAIEYRETIRRFQPGKLSGAILRPAGSESKPCQTGFLRP